MSDSHLSGIPTVSYGTFDQSALNEQHPAPSIPSQVASRILGKSPTHETSEINVSKERVGPVSVTCEIANIRIRGAVAAQSKEEDKPLISLKGADKKEIIEARTYVIDRSMIEASDVIECGIFDEMAQLSKGTMLYKIEIPGRDGFAPSYEYRLRSIDGGKAVRDIGISEKEFRKLKAASKDNNPQEAFIKALESYKRDEKIEAFKEKISRFFQ